MSGNPNGAPSDPENGWKDPHEAMPMVGDAASFAWLQGFMAGTVPDVEVDGWAWMLHGDIGEDNRMYLVTDEEGIAKAKADGEWIESGAHLMLFPADPSTLDGQTTNFNSGAPYVMYAGTKYAHLMIPRTTFIGSVIPKWRNLNEVERKIPLPPLRSPTFNHYLHKLRIMFSPFSIIFTLIPYSTSYRVRN